LQFNTETNQVITVSKLNLNNPYGKLNSNKSFFVVSQEFRVLITSVYQGELGVIWFDGGGNSNGNGGKLKSSMSKPSTSNSDSSSSQGTLPPGSITHRQRITVDQFEIHSLTILNNTKYPTIAILYSDYSAKKYLKFYQLTKLSSKLTEVYGDREVSEDTKELIALQNGGLILVGSDGLIVYNANCSKEDQLKLNLAEPRTFTAFEIIDNLRILITDVLGKLYLIKLTPTSSYSSQGYYKSVDLHLIGHTTMSSSLTYLGNRFIFVGSNAGNSEVWKLPYKNEGFTLYQSLDGLGPVTDLKYLKLNTNNSSALNEDSDSSEPASLICTSGIGNNGTIRQLSTGFSWQKSLKVDIPGLVRIFTFPKLSVLALEFINQIKFIKYTEFNQNLIELNNIELDCSNQTLLMVESIDGNVVQVTSYAVMVYSCSEGDDGTVELSLISTWSTPDNTKILLTSASANGDRLILLDSSNTLYNFNLIQNSLELVNQFEFEKPITFIELLTLEDGDDGDDGGNSEELGEFSNICLLSNQMQSQITIFNLDTLSYIDTLNLTNLTNYPALLTSAKVIKFAKNAKFLVLGLSSGGCLFGKITKDKLFEMDFKPLNGGPINLLTYSIINIETGYKFNQLICTGEQPQLIQFIQNKLIFSPIYSPEANQFAKLPNSINDLILINEDGIEIGQVSNSCELQVKTLLLGAQPRKLLNIQKLNKLAMLRQTGDGSSGISSVQLVNPSNFDLITEFKFGSGELASSLNFINFNNDEGQNYLVVGTGVLKAEDEECHSGNIHLFKVTNSKDGFNSEEDLKLVKVVSIPAKGAVYDLISFKGKLIAAINGMLTLFEVYPTQKNYKLIHTLYLPTTITQLDTIEDYIICQDLVRSVQIIVLNKDLDQLVHHCGDNTPTWPITSRALNSTTILSSDSNFNLILLKRVHQALGRGEKPRISWEGQMHWGDQINCICRKPNDEKSLVFGTAGGAIGVLRTIDSDTYDILRKLVNNTASLVSGVGGLNYCEWREFENDRIKKKDQGFIDGDVLDLFLSLDLDTKKSVVNGVKKDYIEGDDENGEVEELEPLNLPINMVVNLVKEILDFY
jgi:DNA damage-binding protein 1